MKKHEMRFFWDKRPPPPGNLVYSKNVGNSKKRY